MDPRGGRAGGRRGRVDAHYLGGEENDGWKMVWVSIGLSMVILG